MAQQLTELKSRLAEVSDLDKAAQVLEWDQETYMPPGGAATRAQQLATLKRLAHELFISDELGKRLDRAEQTVAGLDPDSDDVRLVRVTVRDYERRRRVPAELVGELARTTAEAHAAWVQARAESKFPLFAPHLQRILDLKRRWVDCFQPVDDPYDPLLDEHEPGMKTAQVRKVFADLKAELVPLVQAIGQRADAVDDSVLRREYDEQAQWDFGLQVIRRFGFDAARGRQDRSVHPFTVSFSTGDVRITTRIDRHFLSSALFGTLHECGHALYNQGVRPEFDRSPLGEGASYGVHESQSRLWENVVGRSREFWTYFFPHLKRAFPVQLRGVDVEAFYRAINRVAPSPIRVEADEVTYNLHIMLRFDLEQELLRGQLKVEDLPQAWNARMQADLGVTPTNDAQGVLQDIHWSSGYLGYFPTYTLGNLLSVQFFETVKRDIPSLMARIARGEVTSLHTWLRQRVYAHGRKFAPDELVQRVTGRSLDAEPYLRYLRTKYSELYGL